MVSNCWHLGNVLPQVMALNSPQGESVRLDLTVLLGGRNRGPKVKKMISDEM